MPEKDLVVKKPDEMVKMRGTFSESELKLGAYLISILEQNKYTYKVRIADYVKKIDKKMKDFDYIYKVALGLSKKQFSMIDREKKVFAIYNFFSRVRYDSGVLEINFDDELHKYLMKVKDKFLLYNLQNIARLGSKYSIRLYELLKNETEMRKRQKRKLEFEISLENLRDYLSIPESYRWYDVKKQIIIPSQKELCKLTDICFNWNPVKIRKRVVAIEFTIQEKENTQRIIPNPQDLQIEVLLFLIPEEHRNEGSIESILRKNLDKGIDYLQSQIEYTNTQKVKNYAAFLKTAIEEDYADYKSREKEIKLQREKEEIYPIIEKINSKYAKEPVSLKDGILRRFYGIDDIDETAVYYSVLIENTSTGTIGKGTMQIEAETLEERLKIFEEKLKRAIERTKRKLEEEKDEFL